MKKINLSKQFFILLTLNLSYANTLFSEALPIVTDLTTDAPGPVTVTINDTSYEVSASSIGEVLGIDDLSGEPDEAQEELLDEFTYSINNTPWYGDSDLAESFSASVTIPSIIALMGVPSLAA